MNIKFGMDNFYVRYLKKFLNQELGTPSALLGAFDKNDLKQLITYLNLPNVKTMFEVQKEIAQQFPELDSLFGKKLKDNDILYTSINIDAQTSEFLKNNIDKIRDFCESVGWELISIMDWVDLSKDINNDGSVDRKDRQILSNIINGQHYDDITLRRADLNLDGFVNSTDLSILDNYLSTGKLTLEIKQTNRKNYFPNKDMLIFVNQFDGTFLYNCAFRDTDGYDDYIHTNEFYKIGLYECTPGQKITISHNSPQPVHLVIGSSPATLKSNVTEFMLNNVIEIDLKSGDYVQYTCSSREDGTGFDAHYVCIQCPSNYGNLSGQKTTTLMLDTGDINFDGKIDMEDYHLLARYTASGPSADSYKWEPTAKQLAVMNVRKDETSPGVDIRDAQYLYRFIQGDPAIPSLGYTYFDITENSDYEMGDNVENLLIIDGHYNTETNIPFMEFVTDGWVIHEKFFNYLLGMAIHNYSTSSDITYLQKLLQEYYPNHVYDPNFFYPGRYNDDMRNLLKKYQTEKISYTIGDLNKDNMLTTADLQLLRNYLDDSADYTKVQKYIDNPEQNPLTEEEILRLDRNGDGIINTLDLNILNEELTDNYSPQLRSRADINGDGYTDESDYVALKNIIEYGSTTIIQNGIERKIDLKNYDITFILGWLDVQTEALIETDYNPYGLISEVSK